MSKTYNIEVTEECQYRHDVVIQIDDDTDIDSICDRIEKMLDYTHGDIWSIGYNTGVRVIKVVKDESPDCRYEVTCYEEEGSEGSIYLDAPISEILALPEREDV